MSNGIGNYTEKMIINDEISPSAITFTALMRSVVIEQLCIRQVRLFVIGIWCKDRTGLWFSCVWGSTSMLGLVSDVDSDRYGPMYRRLTLTPGTQSCICIANELCN